VLATVGLATLAVLSGTLVEGTVVGTAQWLVLRRYVRGSALWMPANAVVWALGMVVIFARIDPAMDSGLGLRAVGILTFTLLSAGAVVGAIHGLALVRLLHSVRLARGSS
jgi:hypothetical protein